MHVLRCHKSRRHSLLFESHVFPASYSPVWFSNTLSVFSNLSETCFRPKFVSRINMSLVHMWKVDSQWLSLLSLSFYCYILKQRILTFSTYSLLPFFLTCSGTCVSLPSIYAFRWEPVLDCFLAEGRPHGVQHPHPDRQHGTNGVP